MTFDPRYAIVTASDSGIGKATAVALAEAGMDVGITWHSDSEGAEEPPRKCDPRDVRP
jgi:NAD(P)-dependent dehydrogenase (short-subunit alcohol dehydrogenase family)